MNCLLAMNYTYSRFFDIGLVQTCDDRIIFYCTERGGYFCEPMYALELNSWPKDYIIQSNVLSILILNLN